MTLPVLSSTMKPRALLLGALVCLAAACLHGYAILRPALIDDDLEMVAYSWTWSRAFDNLWTPHREHPMPLGRLSTAVLVEVGGGRPTAMPWAMALQGPLAVLFG